MDKDVSEKLKLIDSEISNALNTISELEDKLQCIKTDEEGHVLKDECIILREKFSSFNKIFQELTNMLIDLGIVKSEDVEDKQE